MYHEKGSTLAQKNSQWEKHERLKIVANMYLSGKTQWEIARECGVSQSCICKDLKEVRDDWIGKAIEAYDQKMAIELAKIDLIEERAWDEWHRSRGDGETRHLRTRKAMRVVKSTKETKGKKAAHPLLEEVVEEKLVPIEVTDEIIIRKQCGNPAYLDRVAWCIETRCKLLGLLKPEQKNVQNNIVVFDWDRMFTPPPLAADDVERRIVEGIVVEKDKADGILPEPENK